MGALERRDCPRIGCELRFAHPVWCHPNGALALPKNELPPLDPDEPIPYTITPAGHRLLRELEAEEAIEGCDHSWLLVASVNRLTKTVLQCRKCGLERDFNPTTGYDRGSKKP